MPRTKNGVEGYLASGLIKGIGPKTAADIVERFGVATLDILEHQPERIRAKDLESVKADDTARVQKPREERPSQRPPSLREQLRRAQETRPLPGANAPERER